MTHSYAPVHRGRLRLLAALVALTAGVAVTVVTPGGPAAAAVNQIRLEVVSDGTAPFDDLDTNANNGRIRTKDVLTYGWTYSSDTSPGGAVTFVQTLNTSALVRFDASNLAQCTGPGGGSLSADGHTLTCAVAVDQTGAGEVPITVTLGGSVPNGTVVNSTLTANGGALHGGSQSTTVVAVPQLNLQANLYGTPTPASVGGVQGSGYAFSFVVTTPASARGAELVTAPLTFTADLRAISPNAVLVAGSCAPVSNGGYAVPFGRIGIVPYATSANSVVNSGTVTCAETNRTVTVTVTGADLSGSSSPTTGAQGNQISDTLLYLVSGTFTVFVPSTDSTSTVESTIQYRGFDPFSVTGQSNYGAGHEPGGDPSAAACTFVEQNATRANDNCFSTRFGPRSAGYNGYFWTADTTPGGLPAGGATTGSSGDGVASPGQTYWDRLTIYSTSGPALTGAAICDKWNPTETRIVGPGRVYRNNVVVPASTYTVEYAVLSMLDDNVLRTTSCGTGTWYASIEAAGGNSVVNAVRFTPNWTIVNGESDVFFVQFQVQPNPTGFVLANFDSARLGASEAWGPSYYNRVTNNPSYTGNRLTVTDGVLRLTQSNGLPANQQFVAAGTTVTYTLTPTVTRATSATSPVGGVTITDTLPACMRYVPGSARYVSGSAALGVELTAADNGADGIPCTGDTGETGGRLLLKLGPIVPNTTLPAITFQATALRIATDNTAATNTAVIGSDAAVPIDVAKRTTSTVLAIRNQTQFAYSETTATPQVPANESIDFTLAYRNVTGLTVPSVVLLTELPYNGDGSSSFTGTLTYTRSTAPTGVEVRCTSKPHGTITGDPADYTPTCGPTTTALRIVITNLANLAVQSVRITATPSGNATGDRYVNTSTGSYTPSGSSTPVALPRTETTQVTVVSSTIAGRTWRDANADGIRQSGEGPLGDFPVSLAGTNDAGAPVTRSTRTGTDGTYSFTGLRAGSYTVTFDPAALRADQRFSPQWQGTDRGADSDGSPTTGSTGALSLGTGATLADVDQGVRLVPPTVALTTSSASVAYGQQVTLTATVAPATATGTITFTAAVVSGPSAGSTVTLGTATLADGRATLTVALPAYGANTAVASYGGDATYPAASSAGQVVQATAATTRLRISEFRLSGPGGTTDQYVELTNAGTFPVPLAGFVVRTDTGSPLTLPRTAPSLPVGRSYLVVGGGYTLTPVTAPDLTVASFGAARGVRLHAPDTAETIMDAAGWVHGYVTGTPLPALTGAPTDQHAWVRLAQNGTLQDSQNNAVDFKLVSTTGGLVGGVRSTLGSASPSASTSPLRRPAQLVSTLIDPGVGHTVAPNRVVTAGPPKTLVVRRTITNNSGATVTSARVRIISLSAANGAPRPGDAPQPTNPAQLRAVNASTPATALTIGGRTVVAHSLTLQAPAAASPGGGLNSTLAIPLPAGGLPAGESISVAFTFAVDGGGTFWFAYDVEV
ncbi:SdrD B-like domain-containing protein [Micromonospora echinospora]|uniref:SdrD B-like domain-containing protein n=1 Tax=Micromonospora echinospora TaxID=1877 RepID=UPI0037990840